MAACATGAPLGHTLWTLGLFGIGSLVMRGAGCTINDMLDHDLDSRVARTRLRPIAAGDISMKAATAFLAAQCTAGLAVLLSLPSDCFLLGAASLPLVFTYPLFKRITYYPQVVLSACFGSWGALLGFPAMGIWNIPAMIALHASSFAWCMIYDTIYAHQDKAFDRQIGIKSTALKWGERTKQILNRYAVGQIGLLTAAGFFAGMGPCYFAGTAWAAYRLFDMIKQVELDNPDNCWQWFLRNIRTGHVVFLGALGDYACKLLGIGLF
jgi:4-hydroxybenzoate polyprenyltransferase